MATCILLLLMFLAVQEPSSCSISGGLDSLLTLDTHFSQYNNSELVTAVQQIVSVIVIVRKGVQS